MRTPGERITINGVILTVDEKGLLRDEQGTFWALPDQMATTGDPVVRCGVGLLSLPEEHPLTEICKIHDYQDSSPEYQAFNSDTKAAISLRKLVKQTPYKGWAQTMYRLVQIRNWLTGRLSDE